MDEFAKIQTVCAEAGLDVMGQVMSILCQRDGLPVESLAALTPSDMERLYENIIGPAIDDVETELLRRVEVQAWLADDDA